MNRPLLSLIFALVAGAAIVGGELLPARPVRDLFREWLGAGAEPERAWSVTAVSVDSEDRISPLDAALLLRAAERFAPRMFVFLGPVEPEPEAGLFRSRLRDCEIPAVLSATQGAPGLAQVHGAGVREAAVTPAAVTGEGWTTGAVVPPASPDRPALLGLRGGEVVPTAVLQAALQVNGLAVGRTEGAAPGTVTNGSWLSPVLADGTADINPLAARHVTEANLDEILLRVEDAERGQIDPSLDTLFRGRIVAAVPARGAVASGLALAAACNELTEVPAPWWLAAVGVALVASLPWWAMERSLRLLWALAAAGSWLLIAMGIYQEFRMVAPWEGLVLLPLLACVPVKDSRRKPAPGDGSEI